MARSPTGTFTLVAGNPVVTGTIISSDWANTTMPDIGAALTDSLSRTGQGGMLAPIRGVSGSATAPAHSFTDFPRSGMYAVNANEMRYAVNGVDRMRWQGSGLPTQTWNVSTGLWEDLEAVGVVGPNLLDNSNFQIRQRGNSDTTGTGNVFFDRIITAPTSVTGGTTELLYEGEVDYDDEHWIKVSAAGHTAPWYLGQKWLIANGGVTAGRNYTFTVSTGVLTAPIKAKVVMRGYDASAGVEYVLAQGYITLDSDQDVSVVLVPVHQQGSALAGEGDYFIISFTGNGGDNGVDFVLPDGSYRFRTLKLEEGDTFSGYEPTPYAQDELECMKWYQEVSGRWTGYAAFNSSTNLLRGADINFPVPMYFTPTATITPNSAWSPTATAYKSMIRASGDATSAISGTWVNSYTASCEL
jgi:hypothetical protein